ncbi:MAG: dTMP kinase [Planctomycetes bacterium]|nr:dTMP kinase [Planctomycetota bacterium]
MSARRGFYVAIDGVDGCGKTTQAALLCRWLEGGFAEVLHVREPGSTPVAEVLRRLLLSPETGTLDATTEALLFSAARRELVERTIAPALARGAAVVSERCFASTWAYQCVASEPPADAISFRAATAAAHQHARPDLLALLDVPARLAVARIGRRPLDRIEARGVDYQARVAAAYREVAAPGGWAAELLGPDAIASIDASGTPESVWRSLRARVAQRLDALGVEHDRLELT